MSISSLHLAAICPGVRLAARPRSGLDGPTIDYKIPVTISVADFQDRPVALNLARGASLILAMGE
jgi:hypothetical protein